MKCTKCGNEIGVKLIPECEAYYYAIKEEIKAVNGREKIDEDKFGEWLNEDCSEIANYLYSRWKEWLEDNK